MARRKGTRYLKILRGSDQAAKTRLLQYFNGEIKPTYPERRGNRPPNTSLFVEPFGLPFGDGIKLEQYVNSQRFVAPIPGFVTGFATTVAPATADDRVFIPGLLTCRAAITTGRANTAGTTETSKVTGRQYKSYGGTTVTVPFGEGNTVAEQNEETVFRIIRGRVKAENANNQCSFVPGSYSPT